MVDAKFRVDAVGGFDGRTCGGGAGGRSDEGFLAQRPSQTGHAGRALVGGKPL